MELIPNVLAGIEAKPTMHQVIYTYLKLGFIKKMNSVPTHLFRNILEES